MLDGVFWGGGGPAVPAGASFERRPLSALADFLLAGRRQGILRPTFATPTSDEGYQGGADMHCATDTASVGVAAGRACAETERPRNMPLKFPTRMPDVSTHARFREEAVGELQEVVRIPPFSGSGRSPRLSAREGANLQRQPGGCCARFTGYAMAGNKARRTALGRRGARSALFY